MEQEQDQDSLSSSENQTVVFQGEVRGHLLYELWSTGTAKVVERSWSRFVGIIPVF